MRVPGAARLAAFGEGPIGLSRSCVPASRLSQTRPLIQGPALVKASMPPPRSQLRYFSRSTIAQSGAAEAVYVLPKDLMSNLAELAATAYSKQRTHPPPLNKLLSRTLVTQKDSAWQKSGISALQYVQL